MSELFPDVVGVVGQFYCASVKDVVTMSSVSSTWNTGVAECEYLWAKSSRGNPLRTFENVTGGRKNLSCNPVSFHGDAYYGQNCGLLDSVWELNSASSRLLVQRCLRTTSPPHSYFLLRIGGATKASSLGELSKLWNAGMGGIQLEHANALGVDALSQIADIVPGIRVLSLIYCTFIKNFRSIFKFSQLRSLTLVSCEISSLELQQVLKATSSTLTHLDISRCNNITDLTGPIDEPCGFTAIPRHCTNLRSLSITHCPLLGNSLIQLASLPHLTHLDLSGGPAVVGGYIHHLLHQLHRMPHYPSLEYLNISGLHVSPLVLQYIGAISHVDMSNTAPAKWPVGNDTEGELGALQPPTHVPDRLKKLEMNFVKWDLKLDRFRELHTLSYGGNKGFLDLINSDGKYFFQNLSNLNLRCNEDIEKVLRAVSAWPEFCSRIQTLDLSFNSVMLTQVPIHWDAHIKCFPNLQVLNARSCWSLEKKPDEILELIQRIANSSPFLSLIDARGNGAMLTKADSVRIERERRNLLPHAPPLAVLFEKDPMEHNIYYQTIFHEDREEGQ